MYAFKESFYPYLFSLETVYKSKDKSEYGQTNKNSTSSPSKSSSLTCRKAKYSFQTKSGDWIHGAVEQTWDGDPQDIDRDDVITFLHRHLKFLQGERKPDAVVIDDGKIDVHYLPKVGQNALT
jgi:hypothetical protein